MAPLRGWAPRGNRLIGKVPDGRWRTMTFLAALRHDRITAPWLLEGPIDGESFATYVEKVLLPTLRPGDIVIMDNLGSHRGRIIRRFIRSAGAKLFLLPKYSPDRTRSNRCSPSSSTCCAKQPRERSKPSAPQSASFSALSPKMNAPTTSKTQDMHQTKCITL